MSRQSIRALSSKEALSTRHLIKTKDVYTSISTNKEQEKKGKIYTYYLHFIKNEMLYFIQKFLKEMLSEKYWVGQKVHSGFSIKCYGNFWPTQYFLVPYESITFLVLLTKIIFFQSFAIYKKSSAF